jgi:hypothetical protein
MTLILALLCCENFHGGIFPQNEATFVRFSNKIYFVFFKRHGRQAGLIRGDEVANFAINENNFDVCHQAARPLRESGGGNSLAIQRLFFPIKTTIMSQMEFGTAFLALGGLDCLCPIRHDRL